MSSSGATGKRKVIWARYLGQIRKIAKMLDVKSDMKVVAFYDQPQNCISRMREFLNVTKKSVIEDPMDNIYIYPLAF